MKTLFDINLVKAQEYLRVYEEKEGSKLFKGAPIRYFTKEELIKILDIMYDNAFNRKEE